MLVSPDELSELIALVARDAAATLPGNVTLSFRAVQRIFAVPPLHHTYGLHRREYGSSDRHSGFFAILILGDDFR